MTVLAALARRYDRLAEKGEAPPFGYSLERIGFVIALDDNGRPVGQPIDIRTGEGRRRTGQMIAVPASFKRPGITPRAFFLWDNTAFALGVTAAEGKDAATRFADFQSLHLTELAGTEDAGLQALRYFVDLWQPEMFDDLGWPQEMKDQNVVFALDRERRANFIHDRLSAKSLWAGILAHKADGIDTGRCLVTGMKVAISKVHPAIRGQFISPAPGGAFSIVSFNLKAFESYGHEQGANAQVGEPAAFAYTTALNRLLAQDSKRRIQIGDASTVFWAEAGDEEDEETAEAAFGAAMGMPIDEDVQAGKAGAILEGIAKGRPLSQLDPRLAEGVRFYVLGLSPNAARLSVRYWFDDSFGRLADHLARHAADMALDPPPREPLAGVRRLVIETAAFGKYDNIPPQLAGEFLRAILTGGRYPATLLATLLMRLRADGEIRDLRVAMLKAIVTRNRRLDGIPDKKEPPVSLDTECREPGYLLGRLFAVYEYAQSAALGRSVNATVKDKFYGAAATTPQAVFPMLDRNSVPHLAKVRKERRGQAIFIEHQVGGIMTLLSPGADPFPRSLPPEQQALFALGYYHQRNDHFTKKTDTETPEEANS